MKNANHILALSEEICPASAWHSVQFGADVVKQVLLGVAGVGAKIGRGEGAQFFFGGGLLGKIQ